MKTANFTLTFSAKLAMAGIAALMLAGCTSMLPNSSSKSTAKWATYAEAKNAFDAVVIDHTTDTQLKALGYDAGQLPNIRIINYVDVASLFGSAFDRKYLPAGVRKCVDSGEGCFAYVVKIQNLNGQRNGNVAADLFGFRKQTHTTGWEMQATLVLVNKVVVYKLWSGTPEIDTYEKSSTPLGPMQNLGGVFKPF